jgi:hypothetical protein
MASYRQLAHHLLLLDRTTLKVGEHPNATRFEETPLVGRGVRFKIFHCIPCFSVDIRAFMVFHVYP